jgi:hypothetical protein
MSSRYTKGIVKGIAWGTDELSTADNKHRKIPMDRGEWINHLDRQAACGQCALKNETYRLITSIAGYRIPNQADSGGCSYRVGELLD